MKATIIRPDGTRIDVEGTPEEIAKLAPPTVPHVPTPSWNLCTCGSTSAWCQVHGIPWRPTTTYRFPHNAAAACVPNMGQVWIGEVAGAAMPMRVPAPYPSAAACVPAGGSGRWLIARDPV